MRGPHQSPISGLLLSGGIDSAVLLSQLLDRGWQVVPFYVRTDCIWQREELAAVGKFLAAMARPNLLELVQFDMRMADVYGDHWSMSGVGVPDDRSTDEAVFLPGRNPLLLLKPALWCRMHGIAHLALATLAGNPFDDATPEFFARFEAMLHEALGGEIKIARPFERMTKSRVLEMGRNLSLELTFSCLAPVDGLHCGRCNKCAERRRGFREIGLADRTPYFATPDLDFSSLTTPSRD
jgi:7-cyano-7-deazaguanine synthase